MSGQGHLPIGTGRVVSQTAKEFVLDCGCKVTAQAHDVRGHVWTWIMDYSECTDHHHDEYCRPG